MKNRLQKLSQNRGFLAVSFFILGIGMGVLITHALQVRQNRLFAHRLMPSANSPFDQLREEMQKRMEEMDKAEEDEESHWGGLLSGRGLGNGLAFDTGKIEEHEDENFRYFELKVPDLSPDQVDIRVEEGQLTISGRIEKKTESDSGSSLMSSSFQRSFPVPDDVNADQVQLEQMKDLIVIKFPKIKGR